MRSTTPRRLAASIRATVNRHSRLVLGLLGAAALTVLVLVLGPWPITHYQPRTAGAWVVNGQQIGRLNVESGTIDLVRDLGADVVAVVQTGGDAWAMTGQAGADRKIVRVSPASLEVDKPVSIGAAEVVAMGDGRLARYNDGSLSVVTSLGSDAAGSRFDLDLGPDVVLEVGVDGTVAAWGPRKGRIAVVAPDASEPQVGDAPQVGGAAQLALVGDRPAFVDQNSSRLMLDGGQEVDIPGGEVQLQASGPARDVVVVASKAGLYSVDWDGVLEKLGGAPVSVSGASMPRPTVDERCAYAMFPGAAADNTVAVCGGEQVRTSVPTDATATAFRVGSPVGVLNSTAPDSAAAWYLDGRSWRKVPWPEKPKRPDQEKVRQYQPRSFDQNRPPVAVADIDNDALGARPGRVTTLAVLHNDYDPDRDALTVAKIASDDARVTLGPDGQPRVDLTAEPDGSTGIIPFEYTISDGRETATAKAQVKIKAATENEPPRRISPEIPMAMGAAVGRPVRFDVVSQYWDPDGDPMFLDSADMNPRRHRLEVDPVGYFTFTAADQTDIAVSTAVADVAPASAGSAPPVTNSVAVSITRDQPQKPILNSDVVTVAKGKTITFDPLANDIDPNGSGLSLDGVTAKGDPGPVKVALANGKLTVTADAVGESQWVYTASSGGQQESAFVHVRAVEQAGAPHLGDDVVVVQQDRTARVDLLRNDRDPSDPEAVFAATGVEGPLNLGPTNANDVTPAVALQADAATVVVDAGSARMGSYQYQYSAVVSTATGDRKPLLANLVVVVQAGRANRMPEAAVPTPEIAVRAGSATTIALDQVIINPDEVPLTYEVEPPPSGEVFLDGGSLRFRAPGDPGPVTVSVRATDVLTRSLINATVMFRVQPGDNQAAPRQVPLAVRVRSGQRLVVPVPLAGVDPDGDRVRLRSVASDQQPKRVTKVAADVERQAIVIEAMELDGDDPGGLESFTYAVEDGQHTTSSPLRILVVPRSRQSRPPVALPDRLVAATGGTVVVDPLANDSDPDGQPLQLLPVVDSSGGCTAEIVRASGPDGVPVAVRISDVRDGCAVSYRIASSGSTPVVGEIRVTAVPGYPGRPPVLVDDVAVPRRDVETVDVDVMANDSDPDGDIAAARIVRATDATVVDGDSGPRVRVKVGDSPHLAVYTVRDEAGLEASAFVYVPARSQNQPPVATGERLRIGADRAPIDVDLNRLVTDPDGDPIDFRSLVGAAFNLGEYRAGDSRLSLKLQQADTQAGTYPLAITVSDKRSEPVTVTVQVDVDTKANTPPEFIGSPACGDVEAGKSGQAVNLRAVVKDPDPGDLDRLEFKPELNGDVNDALTVKATPSGLELAAAEGPPREFVVSVQVRNVGDQEWSAARQCKVMVRPTSLAPPSMIPVDKVLDEGGSESVSIPELIINGGKPEAIKVLRSRLDGGADIGTLTNTDREVTFRANPKAAGNVSISVDFADAFQRNGSGLIRFRVRGRPDQPTAVRASADPNGGAVTVAWNPVRANNADITSYKISGTSNKGSTASIDCRTSSNSCRLEKSNGIRNGESWTFTVVATNEVGDSPPSEPSNPPATPDIPPEKPVIGKVTEGDKSLTVTWEIPKNDGSPVKSVDISWVANGQKGSKTFGDAGVTSWPIENLTNGVDYCITVTAHNDHKTPSSSPEDCGHIPFGDPLVKLSAGEPMGNLQASFPISIDSNGRDIETVQPTASSKNGDGKSGSCDPRVEVQRVLVTCSDEDADSVHLVVVVTNKGGRSIRAEADSAINNAPSVSGSPHVEPSWERAKIIGFPTVDNGGKHLTWQVWKDGGWVAKAVNDYIDVIPFQATDLKFRVCRKRMSDERNCSREVFANRIVAWGEPTIISDYFVFQNDQIELNWHPSAAPASRIYSVTIGPSDRPIVQKDVVFDNGGNLSFRYVFPSGEDPPRRTGWKVCDKENTEDCAVGSISRTVTTTTPVPTTPPPGP